ncbi:MAG TPA: polyhydroxyalkanoate synthesis regulator DNA-binding domain-containing protein [Vicinamibacteria bacterium]|nr:polyhydroxyalkanoate synthesis regulator DNA-binding domain-containing protein [Vicinamibacteria bacterium]
MGAESQPTTVHRQIRRYGNRKLYDPQARRYVTLDDLSALIAKGQEICVVDQRTGEDLTNPTLAQVLVEEMKRGASRIPRQVLTRLIRLASGPLSAWSRWPEPQDAAGRARQEAERIVSRLLGRGRLNLDEAVALRHELGQVVHRMVSEAQAGVEGRLRALVEKGEDVAGRSLEALRGRIEAFGGYLEPTEKAPARRARRDSRTKRRKR